MKIVAVFSPFGRSLMRPKSLKAVIELRSHEARFVQYTIAVNPAWKS